MKSNLICNCYCLRLHSSLPSAWFPIYHLLDFFLTFSLIPHLPSAWFFLTFSLIPHLPSAWFPPYLYLDSPFTICLIPHLPSAWFPTYHLLDYPFTFSLISQLPSAWSSPYLQHGTPLTICLTSKITPTVLMIKQPPKFASYFYLAVSLVHHWSPVPTVVDKYRCAIVHLNDKNNVTLSRIAIPHVSRAFWKPYLISRIIHSQPCNYARD